MIGVSGELVDKTWPKPWTLEKFSALTLEQRYNLWRNAKLKQGDDIAERLVSSIELSGLQYWVGSGTAHDDPLAIEMEEIINSLEGRAACLQATERGEPALAGVEPLIVAKMGARYGAHDQLTVLAGYQVGTLMKALGYKESSKGKMPTGSVAKTAAVWVPARA